LPCSSSARPSHRTWHRRHRRRAALAGAIAVLALATSACRVDVRVGIDADAGGGGRVQASARLDDDAVERLVGQAAGDPETSDPATRIKVDDLRDAGWTVTGPEPTDDGGLEVVVSHAYDDPAEARRLLAEVAGDPGPLRNVVLRQERTFFKTTTEFAATFDLAAGLGAFTDPELREALASTPEAPLGITTEQLERQLGEAIDRMLGLQVAVRLPGDVTSNAPTTTDNGAAWTPRLGEEVALEARSERWNVGNILALVVALAAAGALAALVRHRRLSPEDLTVTDSNLTVGNDGTTGADRTGT
jgi:hypothetical protein